MKMEMAIHDVSDDYNDANDGQLLVNDGKWWSYSA